MDGKGKHAKSNWNGNLPHKLPYEDNQATDMPKFSLDDSFEKERRNFLLFSSFFRIIVTPIQ